jgi:transcriptional regulator of acetoin/glycerol metabolism
VATQVEETTINSPPGGGPGAATPAAHLVRLLDATRPLVPSARHCLRDLDRVLIGRGAGAAERRREDGVRTLSLREDNPRVSGSHASLRRVMTRWLLEDLGSKNGTLVGGAPAASTALADGDLIEIGRTFYLFRDGVPTAPDEPADEVASADTRTLSPPLARELRALAVIAPSQVSVVVHGETGTGKELIARAVHELSGRRGPFIPVNCGAIPDTLIESELFGAKRGAYSDAKEDRPGLFRSAHRGTLFLDEIGDLKLGLQAAFLRALQEREVVPVGQAQAVPVDVRVVSASHRDVEKLVAAGTFREDLAARLSGFTLRLPPLRARPEDLGLLIAALVRRHAPDPEATRFHPDALRLLLGHTWPRNVRELEKRLATALVLAGAGPVQVTHLGDLAEAVGAPAPRAGEADDPQRALLVKLLEEHQGNLSAVARALGKDRVQIRRWLRRYRLDPDAYRDAEPDSEP